LCQLNLNGSDVTNAGLKELAGCKQLSVLDLSMTLVSDAGLKEFVSWKQLRRLYLYGCQVPQAKLAVLRQALPQLQVYPRAKSVGAAWVAPAPESCPILLGMGFAEVAAPRSPVAFRHAGSGAEILLPLP
jgi:hypothetical protein